MASYRHNLRSRSADLVALVCTVPKRASCIKHLAAWHEHFLVKSSLTPSFTLCSVVCSRTLYYTRAAVSQSEVS